MPSQVRHAVRLLVTLLCLSVAVQAQNAAGLAADKREAIEKLISTEMSRLGVPGLSVAVATDGRLVWSQGYGLADLENNVPVRATTAFRLGSISKPITAVAVMQLAERGKLDLDAPIQKYCPDFPEKQWPVTARLLLGHLAGVRHYKGLEFESTRHYPTVVAGLAMFKDDPLLSEPGTKFTYTTHGYAVLGCAVEGASGMKFDEFVRDNISRPAGMDRLRVDNVFEIIPNRAQGYRRAPNGHLLNSGLADTSYKIPGGGFISTVEDLAKFAIALQNEKLLKRATLDQMWTTQKTRDGKATDYGLGWAVRQRNGLKTAEHGGAQQRVSTYLFTIPEKRVAVALMSNLEGAGQGLSQLAARIADLLLADGRAPAN